jgi:MFS family permease
VSAEETSRAHVRLVWTVLVPFAAGFFLSNYFRIVNAVLAPDLVDDLGLTAADLGLLSSVYFFTTALFQLPLGLLIDRYGPRRVQAVLMAVAAIGVLIFALGQNRTELILGRAIMGVGAAGALMTSFQAVILWFPPRRWPFFNGCILSGGGLGALAATSPTELVLQFAGWRGVMVAAGVTSIAVCLITCVVVPGRRELSENTTLGQQIIGMGQVYRDRVFWRIAPVYAVTVGGTLAFQGLWSGPWLKDVAHLLPDEVAGDLLVVTVLQIVSYVFVGYIADVLGRRGVSLLQIVGVGTGLFLFSELPLLLPSGGGRWLVLFGVGSLANASLLCFPILAARFPSSLMGRANTALNLIVFTAAFVAQYAIGVIIDLFSDTPPVGYPSLAYQMAFGILMLVQLMAWIWYLIPTWSTYLTHSG